MTETLTVYPQTLDYYNYYVMCNYVVEVPIPVIQNGYTYEENGVYYCTSATQKGVYCYTYVRNNPLHYVDPDGEFVQYIVWAAHYLFTGLENMLNGVSNPWKDAKQQADGFVNGVNNAFRVELYNNGGVKVNAGLDMFNFGANINASYTTTGGTTLGFTAGYGFMGGWHVGGGFNQRIGEWNVGGSIGGGNNHWGWNASVDYKGYGAGYGRTYYGGSHAQTTGTASILFPGGSFRLENDFWHLTGKTVGVQVHGN